jgi:hypothetical protein
MHILYLDLIAMLFVYKLRSGGRCSKSFNVSKKGKHPFILY